MRRPLPVVRAHPWFFIALGVASLAVSTPSRAVPNPLRSAAQRRADPRIVQSAALLDADGNGLSDSLEEALNAWALASAEGSVRALTAETEVDLLVALDHAPVAGDAVAIEAIGGRVLESWSELVYALRVAAPASSLHALAAVPGVMLVEENAPTRATLHYTTSQTGARRAWSTYSGDTNHNVAVLDTGIDVTHTDLSGAGKIAAWTDVSGTGYATATDKAGHGTPVAGIIAGTGAAGPLTGVQGFLNLTTPLLLLRGTAASPPVSPGYFPVNTSGGAASSVAARMIWSDTVTGTGQSLELDVFDAAGGLLGTTGLVGMGHTQPMALGPYTVAAGTSLSFDWHTGIWRHADNTAGYRTPAWVQSVSPMMPVSGGNLMRGVAPGANLVGVKVLSDVGVGVESQTLAGLTWVSTNKSTHKIVVANLSLDNDAPAVSATLDTAVDNLTRISGIVVVCSAGNRRQAGGTQIGSPGSASAAITVGATNESDQITDYSSYGAAGVNKPDLAAPGGSVVTHRRLASVSSNNGEPYPAGVTPTPTAPAPAGGAKSTAYNNDYVAVSGTSFAAPHVAAGAALVARALESTWSFSPPTALKVKALLLMTATETNATAESTPNPALNRGARDTSEGYGRLNIEAAVEAAGVVCPLTTAQTDTLGAAATDRKAWARYFDTTANTLYVVTLTNPAGADYDLYVYQNTYNGDTSISNGVAGDPVLQTSSVTAATGGTERVLLPSAASSARYYLVVKRVSGAGTFSLTCAVATLGVSVTPTTWTLGTVPPNTTKTTWLPGTPALGGAFTATNTGNIDEYLRISSGSSTYWAPETTQALDRFVVSWGRTAVQGTPPTYYPFTTSQISLGAAALAPSSPFAFDLRFQSPTSSSSKLAQSFAITVAAVATP